MHRTAIDIAQEPKTFEGAPRVIGAAGVVGLVMLGASAAIGLSSADGVGRLMHSYLVAFAFFLSLALGAQFFVQLHHLTRAGWSVVARRFAEGIAGTFPLMALLAIPLLLGMRDLYHWAHPGAADHDALLQHKSPWLNPSFFAVRIVVYFAIWNLLSHFFIKKSFDQDRTGDPKLTFQMERFSAPAMVLFALTLCFAAFDLLMSLDPHWYSTMFGVYYFAGSAVAFFATLPIMTGLAQRSGRLTRAITPEHFHDFGKLIFAFTVFWAYIAFSQFMLIWYGNIPEETVWYIRRMSGGWGGMSLLLLFGHFVIPFALLISRTAKRRLGVLTAGAVWVLIMHYVDVYWLVMPEARGGSPTPGLLDVTCFLGVGGLFVAGVAYRLRRHALVPERDPRLRESLAFENA